jgi:hypothetical protein
MAPIERKLLRLVADHLGPVRAGLRKSPITIYSTWANYINI